MVQTAQNSKLKYAILELVANNGSSDKIEKGLLRGMTDEEGGFVWIKSLSKVTRMCSLGFYNILSVETHDGQARCLTFFKAETHEQTKAVDLVKDTIKTFENIIDEKSGLINTDKYVDIPAEEEVKSGTSYGSGAAVTKPISYTNNTPSIYTGNHTTYTKKDPEALAFKREDKRPTKTALKKMKEKVLAIAKGEYKPKLQKVSKEEKTKAAGK